MTFARITKWRWVPRLYRSQHVNAPYRNMIHIGYWLVLWGRPK
jgi:hypothetical protein